MVAGGVSALPNGLRGSGAFLKKDERADQFITPLDLIHETQLQLRKLTRRFHGDSFPGGDTVLAWQRTV
jgi:hypothetical protein